MADVFSKKKRSWIMARVRGRDTKPEMIVRSLVHRLGYRFRLHRRQLPGNPDLVFQRHKKVVFIHGCFWHGHKGCLRATRPEANRSFWRRKLDGNIERDRDSLRKLRGLGWDVLVVWECETKKLDHVRSKLASFFKKTN